MDVVQAQEAQEAQARTAQVLVVLADWESTKGRQEAAGEAVEAHFAVQEVQEVQDHPSHLPLIVQLWHIGRVLRRLVRVLCHSRDVDLVQRDTKDVDERRVPWEAALIEDSVRGDEELLRSRIPEAPRLCALRVVELCAIAGVPVTASSHNFAGGSLAVRPTDAPIGARRSRAIPEL